MFARQYAQALEDKAGLMSIKTHEPKVAIGIGSLVESEKGLFYIAVGLGKVTLDNIVVTVISPGAPVTREMMGKKVGETYTINDSTTVVQSIW
jgi:transcription elongation GreA/GreB family factor